jgi:hypothetical protein
MGMNRTQIDKHTLATPKRRRRRWLNGHRATVIAALIRAIAATVVALIAAAALLLSVHMRMAPNDRQKLPDRAIPFRLWPS